MRHTLILLENQYRDFGLLVLRLGIGGIFVFVHGWPKLMGGPDRWEALGTSAGLTVVPYFWGFMAAFAESVGAFLLMLGLFTRYVLVLLIITMVMAANFHLGQGDDLNVVSHSVKMAVVFLAIFLTGPGRYSIDARFRQPKGSA